MHVVFHFAWQNLLLVFVGIDHPLCQNAKEEHTTHRATMNRKLMDG
jgi:hypothetical protein